MTTKTAAEFLGGMGVSVGARFVLREAARAMVKFVFPGAGVLKVTLGLFGAAAVDEVHRRGFAERSAAGNGDHGRHGAARAAAEQAGPP